MEPPALQPVPDRIVMVVNHKSQSYWNGIILGSPRDAVSLCLGAENGMVYSPIHLSVLSVSSVVK
jgi:hypothetical protein